MMSKKSGNILAMFLLFFRFSVSALETGGGIDSIDMALLRTSGMDAKIRLMLETSHKLKTTDPDHALYYASLALDQAKVINRSDYMLEAMIDIGTIQTYKTDFKAALEIALEAEELANKLGDEKSLGYNYLTIGMVEAYQGNFSSSFETHFSALRIFEKLNDNEGKVNAFNGIGNICYYQGDIAKASEYYNQALDLARKINDTVQIANILNNVGLVEAAKGETLSAINHFKEAIAINDLSGFKIRLATNYMNLGNTFLKMEMYDDFLVNYNKAIGVFSEFRSWYNLARCYDNIAGYYILLGMHHEALDYLRKALAIGEEYNLHQVLHISAAGLESIYLEVPNADSAYKYSILREAQKDSIDVLTSETKLALLELEYSYDKQLEKDKNRQERKNFTIIILALVILSGIITIILFVSRQRVRTKNARLEQQRLADEVDYKNKELTLHVMNLIKKNEILVDISNRLIKLEQDTGDESLKKDIMQLINTLQRNSSSEIWEEFEVRFRQVHSSFYEKLLQKYPDLSSNELKLCALLRLNLTTKEICELSGQRPSSLDVARYRLRKKLGLANSQVNLITFLSQI